MNVLILFTWVILVATTHSSAKQVQKENEKNVYRRSEPITIAGYVLKAISPIKAAWDHFKAGERWVAVRLDNMSSKKLHKPKWYMKNGIVDALPPFRILSGESAIVIFRKKPSDTKINARTSGLLAYEIVAQDGTVQTLLVIWKAPQLKPNQFRVWVTSSPVTKEGLAALYAAKTKTAVVAKDVSGRTKQCDYDPVVSSPMIYCSVSMGTQQQHSFLQVILSDTADQTAVIQQLANKEG